MRIFWKNFNRTAATALTCGLLAMTTSGAWAQDKPELVGRVVDIDGPTLKTNRLKEDKWYQAYPKMNTYLKERMIATPDTTATIQFTAGGRAVIASGTQVEVVSPRRLKIVKGTAWLKFDKDRLNKEEFQIQTSGGVMGIEGTEFIVTTDEAGNTKLTVVEGSVSVDNGSGDKKSVKGGDYSDFSTGALKVANYAAYGSPYSVVRDAAFAGMDEDTARVLRPVVNRALWYVPGRYRYNRFFYGRGFGAARRTLHAINTGNVYVPGVGGVNIGKFKKPKEPIRDIAGSGNTPTFTWKKGGGVKNYSVVVATDPKGEDVVWYGENKTSKRIMKYPDYGPALTAGQTYHVFITPIKKNGEPKTEKGKSLAGKGTFQAAGHQPKYQSIGGVKVNNPSPPSVEWGAVANALAYRVNVQNEGGDTVWSSDAKETSYTYPATGRALPEGNYTVSVEAFDAAGNKMAESPGTGFAVTTWEAEGLAGPSRPTEEASAPSDDTSVFAVAKKLAGKLRS